MPTSISANRRVNRGIYLAIRYRTNCNDKASEDIVARTQSCLVLISVSIPTLEHAGKSN